MKKSVYLSIVAFLCILVVPVSAKEDPRVLEIRKWYSHIEASKKLKKTVFSTGDDGPEVAKLIIYRSTDGALKKIYSEVGGEHGTQSNSYYFRNGKLFFMFEKSNHWRFTGNKGADGLAEVMDVASETRLYFSKGQCFQALTKEIKLVGADELNALLKAAKNKKIPVVAAMNDYIKRAKALSAIKTKQGFTNYFFK